MSIIDGNLLDLYLQFAKEPYKPSVLDELQKMGWKPKIEALEDVFARRQIFIGEFELLLDLISKVVWDPE